MKVNKGAYKDYFKKWLEFTYISRRKLSASSHGAQNKLGLGSDQLSVGDQNKTILTIKYQSL